MNILEYPILPPSINGAYKVNRKTGAFYSDTTVKAYKDAFQIYARTHWIKEINEFNPELKYKLYLNFHFKEEELINLDYGINKRRKKKYKKVDTSNRLKIIEDCISKAFGFDDCQIFAHHLEKTPSTQEKVVFTLEAIGA